MNYQQKRYEFIGWVKKQLIGDKLQDDILIENNPLDRYVTGILYPKSESLDELDDIDFNEDADDVSQVRKVTQYQPPSSLGFSFYICFGEQPLRVFFNAYQYLDKGKGDHIQRWEKQCLGDEGGQEIVFHAEQKAIEISKDIWEGKGRIDVSFKPHNEGQIATVSLTNMLIPDDVGDRKQKAEKSLFEVELKCIVDAGLVFDYPRVNKSLLSEEEREIELRYKDERVYAVGHGVAVDWKENTQGQLEIFSDFMPVVEVPQVTTDTSSSKCRALSFEFLSKVGSDNSVFEELTSYIHEYKEWILKQEQLASQEQGDDQDIASCIVKKMLIAEERMKRGLCLLKQDALAREAFGIANRVMLAQMRSSLEDQGSDPKGGYKWRPFQLAFMLMVLESAIDEDSEYRDVVDLIWFPTGGGKTEAYLGVMAFMFVYRRMKYPASSGGTVAIMRYTLRLLTSQQFLRACKVISALELIRREDTDNLGVEPFTVGLWLGSGTTPNTFRQALEKVSKDQYSKFILSACPWCQESFTVNNYISSEDDFHFTCLNKNCDFGKEESNVLPYNVVDDALYKSPPSLLIATVDKFARLAWEDRANKFFGTVNTRPPELIIQDELHLISGALGSIVGLYEVGFETILLSKGIHAKYIASTATIKRAQEQIKALFARDMSVFPPSGIRHNDSYFAKTVPLEEKPGRLYVGYLGYGSARVKAIEPLAGTLLAAPTVLFKNDEGLMDAWWTQVVYHGSLKGVGNSRTNYQSGVLGRLNKINEISFLEELNNEQPGLGEGIRKNRKISVVEKYPDGIKGNDALERLHDHYYPVRDLNIKSLTSNQTAHENNEIFEMLALDRQKDCSIDVVLATEMISVGLDVSRLALMIINGQPLTTAEYIQASSRVGRGNIPGIVFVNYYKTQARSLSHYENFKSYHDTFYRYVEPTSLTPFTYQVRQRALHAALVIAMRHSDIGLLDNKGAELFNSDSTEVKKVVKIFKKRVKNAFFEKISTEETMEHIDHIVSEWNCEVDRCEEQGINLRYNPVDGSAEALLFPFEDEGKGKGKGLWKTLNSMRNVEKTGLFRILRGISR